jgi:hypothetical protein
MGKLRGYGNSIVAPLAAEFLKAYMDCYPGSDENVRLLNLFS